MAEANRVLIGENFTEFPGGTFNTLVDDYNRRKEKGLQVEKFNRPNLGWRPFVSVDIHNGTSDTIEPGHIFGFAQPIFTIAQDPNAPFNLIRLKGVAPDATRDATRFVVSQTKLEQDEIGPGVIIGLCWAKVNLTDAAHTKVKVESGEHLLQSSDAGIEPVWMEPSPGAESIPGSIWALLLLGGGGGGGTVNFKFGAASTVIGPATGWDIESAGGGSAVYVGEDGEQDGEEIAVINRYFNKIAQWSPLWILDDGSVVPITINVGCTPGPPLTIT